MEFKNFVDKCVEIFQNAKNKKDIAPRVKRGRAGNCSSACEDLIAIAISEMIPQKYHLLVDYPLTVQNKDQKRMIYPDITILSGDKLIGLVEVKNDLGYMPEDWAKLNQDNLERLQKAESITYRKNVNADVKDREPGIPIMPVDKLDQIVVVITGENAHGKLKSLQNFFILMPRHHPNKQNADKDVPEIIKDPSGWNELKKYLTGHYT